MKPPNELRKAVTLPATIHFGDGRSPVDCTVIEISETSALLSVQSADLIPDNFMLTFAHGAKVRRHCIVVSREPGQISVEMTKGLLAR